MEVEAVAAAAAALVLTMWSRLASTCIIMTMCMCRWATVMPIVSSEAIAFRYITHRLANDMTQSSAHVAFRHHRRHRTAIVLCWGCRHHHCQPIITTTSNSISKRTQMITNSPPFITDRCLPVRGKHNSEIHSHEYHDSEYFICRSARLPLPVSLNHHVSSFFFYF